VVFDYTPTRSRDGPIEFLGDYAGFVQADAYQGYDKLFSEGKCSEVGCWDHTPRKFYDARQTDPLRAHQVLTLIGKLYEVERQAKEDELDVAGIKKLRKERSKPILAKMEPILGSWSAEALPKSPIGKATAYALGQWTALNRYVDNGFFLLTIT